METRSQRNERLRLRVSPAIWNQYRQGILAQSAAEALARLPEGSQFDFLMSFPKEKWGRDYLRIEVQKYLDEAKREFEASTQESAVPRPPTPVEAFGEEPEFQAVGKPSMTFEEVRQALAGKGLTFAEALAGKGLAFVETQPSLESSLRAVERALRGLQTDQTLPIKAATQVLEGLVQRFEARVAQPPEVRSTALAQAAERLDAATKAIGDVKAFYEDQWAVSIAKTQAVTARLEDLEARLTRRVQYLEQFDAVRTLAEKAMASRGLDALVGLPTGYLGYRPDWTGPRQDLLTIDPTYATPATAVPGEGEFKVGDTVVVLGRDRLYAGRVGKVVGFTTGGTPSAYNGTYGRVRIAWLGDTIFAYTHDCLRVPDTGLCGSDFRPGASTR